MAVKTWTGAVSGNYSTTGNWDGGTPVGGDDVIIDAGSVNIDDGLDQSAVDLASFYVGPGYTGQFGNSDTAPLIIEATLVTIDGGGANGYLSVADSDVVKINAVGPTGTGNLTLVSASTCPLLIVNRGIVKVKSGTFTKAVLSALNGVSGNAALNVLDATIATLWSGPGTASILAASASGVITNAYVSAAGVLDIVAGTLTNLWALGGVTKWRTESGSPPTLAAARLFAGSSFIVFASPVARTIALLETHVGSSRTINDPAEALTISATNDFGGNETDSTDD